MFRILPTFVTGLALDFGGRKRRVTEQTVDSCERPLRLRGVIVLRKAVALVLVAFWGLVTAHCGLEQLPGFSFLECCEHPGSAPHQDDDCRQDACSIVESGSYRNDTQPAVVPAPVLILSPMVVFSALAFRSDLVASGLLCSSPPELAAVWQFDLRTAPQPRAPSFIS